MNEKMEENLTLYPWVMKLKDNEYTVYYDILNSIAISIDKIKAKKQLIRILRDLDFIFIEGYNLFMKSFIPGSPLNYLISEYPLPDISRVDLLIPTLENDEYQRGIHKGKILAGMLCESSFSTIGKFPSDKVFLDIIDKVVNLKPKFLTLTYNRELDDYELFHRMLEVFKFNGIAVVLKMRDTLLSKDVINLIKKVDMVVVTTFLSESTGLYLDVFRNNHFSDKIKALVYVDLINDQEEISKLDPKLFKEDRVLFAPYVNIDEISDNFSSVLNGFSNLFTKYFRIPSYEVIGDVYFGDFSCCKYGGMTISIINDDLKFFSCPYKPIYQHKVGIKKIDNHKKQIRDAIEDWKNISQCAECAFRIGCFFCQEFTNQLSKYIDSCYMRQIFHNNLKIIYE